MKKEMKKKFNYLLPPADLWPNFALESQGAKLVPQMTSATFHNNRTCRLFGIYFQQQPLGPNVVIQGRNHLSPGQCWAFAGFPGRLSIKLSHRITVTHVSLGHIPKSISPTFTVSSAPKEFSVYEENMDSFNHVSLKVKNNWGQLDYTCLYNFRVHGVVET
ncbi:SUN domain-containing protein 3-like isoform X2 [Poecilia latipinna]|uniref:SUN domain-containing protein 3-like isoform X2 n=1 Tax=Poecilia latipinna TaxID=48699 RepID=UPI00072ECF18|nr:PREDICTED: SUN domain-containing protein 3-like isoform X2 [Poecilia latipinna]